FHPPPGISEPIVTLSGGVGELIYNHLQGQPWPPTTHYGDLGIDLARRLLQAPRLSQHLRAYVPTGGGRATVYGLLRHDTEIAGSTLFLPRPEILPLKDLPVLGAVSLASTDSDLRELLRSVTRSPHGGCLFISLDSTDGATVRALGIRLAEALRLNSFPPD